MATIIIHNNHLTYPETNVTDPANQLVIQKLYHQSLTELSSRYQAVTPMFKHNLIRLIDYLNHRLLDQKGHPVSPVIKDLAYDAENQTIQDALEELYETKFKNNRFKACREISNKQLYQLLNLLSLSQLMLNPQTYLVFI